ncbi:unnamed protein product [Rotaria magnacalcarata]|uniref:DDB1-and CUL4-associated factor 6 n=3 Tax=Rotaria magnacalcarata TaxID=392030 RepID=A0A819R0B6_9BILA|nr:unnamed protein product [Rotaria magnacalcarata]CAF2107647.1 unnamed protein product [Rotaria magnacalcarata]CAF2147365.1 unnamed protein product [Rotaria magnacalcarata]CAF2260547.1 unnamed protein product [Rotaria magnacalcarata]CAF3886671.1 unnamed protein product [Rotaria magnacalcarata]
MPYLSDRQYGLVSHGRLLAKLKNSSSITRRLKLGQTLNVHRGCVNTICWNENGSTILSGSDDQHLIVTDPYTTNILTSVHSGHRENIFSAKFLPETNDRRVVSCSGDGIIFHTNFDRPNNSHSNEGCFTCHGAATAYEVRVIPQTPNLFFSCSDDCTVRLYDLRTKSNCLKAHCNDDVIIRSKWGITSIDINPMNPNEIVCACSDSSVRLYDHRKLSTQLSSDASVFRRGEASINGLISRFVLMNRKEKRPSRITSVVFNQHGTEILASYSSESLYLLDPKQTASQELSQARLSEHRNEKRARRNTNESKPTVNEHSPQDDKKTSQFKRLRLRGDWSDTGPDSRPMHEQESQTSSNTNNSEQQQPENEQQQQPAPLQQQTPRNRNIQNIFMQRMSDILTQLVTSNATENEEQQSAETPNNSNDNTDSTPTITEVNTDNETTSTSTIPIVQSPPSPTSNENSESTTTTTNESNSSRERLGFFDLLFGRNRRSNDLEEEDEEDDDDDDDDDNDNDEEHSMDDEDANEHNENSQASSTTTDNAAASGRARRPLMASKWDRLMKRREAERRNEENHLKNVPSLGLINSYDGHRNARTMIKEANFWSDSYVMSGSDCGHIFIWNKFTGKIVRIIQADEHVVNCVQPHPLDYPILASSGIDYDIKLFSPLAEAPIDDSELIRSTIKRNHEMMEETSSTITVPATFMFRMLTSFYQLRRPEGLFGLDDDEATE